MRRRVPRTWAAAALLALSSAGNEVRADEPSPATPVGKPRAVFDREAEDFGVARQEETLRTEFRLKNEGDAPLEVTGLRADCGCAAATIESREVAPGATTPILVALRTLRESGVLAKRILVLTNDPSRPLVELKIRVDIAAGIVVAPSRFLFGDIPAGTAPSQSLRVQWKEGVGKPFRLTSMEAMSADVVLESKPFDAPPWHGYEVTATFRKPPPVGIVSGIALLRTDDPGHPRLTAAIQAQVSGKVWVDRRSVSLGWVPSGKGRTTAVVCRSLTPDVDLGEVSARARKGRVEAKAVRSGKDWVVTIRLPESAAPGRVDDVVEILSSIPGEPPAEVVISGFVNAPAK
jgi:hypothetical protein